MISQRVQYGIDNFMDDKFFEPLNQRYCLEEKSDSGRSELTVEIEGDTLCSKDYDHQGKCNFLKEKSEFKLKRSVDHVLLQRKNGQWIAHFIEMKSQVDNKRWYEIRQKNRASYFNFCAIEKVLGIHIDSVRAYTTYERTRFADIESTADLKTFVQPLGEPLMPMPKTDWESGTISVNIGEIKVFEHKAVKMERTEDGRKLVGHLRIE